VKPVLAIGSTSLVGVALARRSDVFVVDCAAPGDIIKPASPGRRGVRVEAAGELAKLVVEQKPEIILYCHAVCDVGRCEEDPAWAEDVNVGGARNLLAAVDERTRIVYVSSDHVFGVDGCYREDDAPRPISVYGRTRVAAEKLILEHANSLVVRPGLAVGPSKNGRTGHMDWLRHRATRGLPITIVADEARSAVWADDLAERLVQLARSDVRGIRHVAATRMVSRPELARFLMAQQNLAPLFHLQPRAERPYPHLGRIELRSRSGDAPLRSVVG
jgi:dTDP-4-dehydrorhamnose reductase